MKEILYEDKDIIVCHKKAGIPVQSARLGQKDMVSILNNYLAEKGEPIQVNVIHRLDQPVEGVIVFAKTKKAAAGLSKQIQQGSMNKIYHAVCCVEDGKWLEKGEERQSLADYMVKDGRTNTSSVCGKDTKDAKKAELEFAVRESFVSDEKKYVLVEIHLKTGRHHQIRVQMAHAGLPLYGDQKYNQKWEAYKVCTEEGKECRGLGLCAVSLTFDHPVKGKRMVFEVKPEGEVFQSV